MSFLLTGVWRGTLYTAGSVLVFLATLLVLRAGEAFRLSEAWFSPQALWRNLEATGPDFMRLGLLTLLPAALLGGLFGGNHPRSFSLEHRRYAGAGGGGQQQAGQQ